MHERKALRLKDPKQIDEYIRWFGLAKEVLSDSIPPLNDTEIAKFISKRDWLMIPAGSETNMIDSTRRPDPNIYFSLKIEGKVHVGLICNTMESIRKTRNLLRGFHVVDRESLITELRKLDGAFKTNVGRKIKEHHPFQAPNYKTEYEFPTNMIDDSTLKEVFRRIDNIIEESEELMKIEPKSWHVLRPRLVIAEVTIDRDEDKFKEVLRKLKPAYRIALRIKTDEEIKEENEKQVKEKTSERQRMLRDFVNDLKKKNVTGKEFREAVSRWNKEHPWDA